MTPSSSSMTTTERLLLLVTGGTGTLGCSVTAQLERAGTDYQVLSRHPGPRHRQADLLTGNGLDAALRGVETVINCATSPRRDVAAAQNLLAAASRGQVRHLVHISIVGIDRVPLGYYREKLAVESLITDSGVPHTILRATQSTTCWSGCSPPWPGARCCRCPPGPAFSRSTPARWVPG